MRAVNSSAELIRHTRGGDWPGGPVTEEYDFADLVWHEREFRERSSFAYSVRDEAGAYIGCAYLYPMGLRTELTPDLAEHDVDVSWWVTPDAYERGDYDKLYRALQAWVVTEFPFEAPWFSNAEVPPSRGD